jgi:hypothetical protein
MHTRTFAAMALVIVAMSAQAESAVTYRDLDAAACQSWHGKVAKPAEIEDVAITLGLMRGDRGWSAGRGERDDTFHYRIAFRRLVPLGSILVPGYFEVQVLKQDATYPGDPADATQWTKLGALPHQSGGYLFTLPVGAQTRAVLLTEKPWHGYSQLQGLRLFRERFHNVTPDALAYAAEEYTPPNTAFIPNPVTHLTSGLGSWVNAGPDQTGFVPRPAVSEIHPTWVMLTWRQEQTLSGIWLHSNVEKLTVEVYTGPADIHPRAGTEEEWRKLRDVSETSTQLGEKQNLRWLSFKPVTAKGLRLTFLKSAAGGVASVSGLHALSDLGDKPVPAARSSGDEMPPLRIPYQVAENGNLSFVILDAEGRRIRTLVSRGETTKGDHSIGWDLKDDEGNIVAPGAYRWTALAYPDPKLRYEMTVYPNVERYAPENSPWLNGSNGSGGWMADHSTPCSACATGDRVYLGSYVAESGVSLIECDLQARKKWGYHSFAAWTGAMHLAADAKEVFVASPILGTSNESVWAVDIATKKVRNVLSLTPTAARRRGMKGVAVADGKLYLSVRGNASLLEDATNADDADIVACQPPYPVKRKPRVAYEVVPDQRDDFLRLFRLTRTPPGGATAHTLAYLETAGGPSQQQHVVLAFKRPVPIGSVVFPLPAVKDGRLIVSVLKPGAPYPPNAENNANWLPFPQQAKHAWDVIAAPEGTQTRALRISFVKGAAADGDPLAGLLDSPKGKDDDLGDLDKPKAKSAGSADFGNSTGAWKGQLEGMKLLRRRFANVTGDAKIRVNSGKVAADGSWDAQRNRPLTDEDPGVYVLEWKQPQTLHGLAIKEIDGAITKIDVLTDQTAGIDLAGRAGWQQVAEYRQERRDHHSGFESANPTARYVDGYVDFGRAITTRAVRLRIVKQWIDNAPDSRGIRFDLGGQTLDPARCRVWGVAALKYLGGEAPIDLASNERIEVWDSQSGKPLGEAPLEKPGEIACNSAGEVVAISGKDIVKVSFTGAKPTPIVTDLVAPTDLAFDKAGLLYVFDGGDRHQIRVYEPSGKYLRSIGQPGGIKAGTWVPERLGDVTAIAIDQENQIWVVDNQYYPKRITVWSTTGEFKKELLGNTAYGGGGVLDRGDKSRLFYGPLEFELDWKSGQSHIKNLTWTGATPAGEVPIRVNDRLYVVTRPQFAQQQIGVVYLYEKDHLKLAAAMGIASEFAPLHHPDVHLKLGSVPLATHNFLWSDLNGDGQVQAEEVKLMPRIGNSLTLFNDDLGIQAGPVRYQVKSFLPNGVPVYEIKEMPKLVGGALYRLDNGHFHRQGESKVPDASLSVDGRYRWTYPNEGAGVLPPSGVKPYSRDQNVCQFGLIGHETEPAGIGEFVVIHTNTGGWNIWTADGLLVGPIFRDRRAAGAAPWSMKAHERGMSMDDVTSGEEHFSGWLCKTPDGKYYAIAGHNHISVVEVLGLDKFKRLGGPLKLSADDIAKAREWDSHRQKVEVYARAPVLDVYRFKSPPAFDGKLAGFGPPVATMPDGAAFRLGFDDRYLYLACSTRGMGPLANSGEQWDRLFKTGAAVDLHLCTDPAAPSDRQAAVAGDERVLLTFANKKSMAVLYRPVSPGAPSERSWRVTSPTGELTFDEVREITGTKLVRTSNEHGYVLEAAIPLAELKLKPVAGLRLKLDWGVLVAGPAGTEVLRRVYWANRGNQIVSDAPTEARLSPQFWGYALFHGLRPSTDDRLAEIEVQDSKAPSKDVKKDVTDILDDLKTKPKAK